MQVTALSRRDLLMGCCESSHFQNASRTGRSFSRRFFLMTSGFDVNVKQNFTSLGKLFFTSYGNQIFTLYGKEFFTLFGKENFTLCGKQFFTSPYGLLCQVKYLVN